MRVLVCGGRDFAKVSDHRTYLLSPEVEESQRQYEFLLEQLSYLHDKFRFTELVHGGARGADSAAGMWAARRGIPCRVFPADWKKHGKSAGSIRNQQMLFESQPDLVVAFPGGNGTADMVRKARQAGVRVIEVTYDVENHSRVTSIRG